MHVATRLGILVSMIVGVCALHAVALACSPGALLGGPAMLPRHDSADVPVNAVITWVYPVLNFPGDAHEVLSDVMVRAESGAPVAGSVRVSGSPAAIAVIFTPDAPLTAHTRYEVLDRAPTDGPLDAVLDLSVRASFTTGDSRLESAPAPPGDLDVRYECCTNPCCTGTHFTLSWAEVADAHYAVERLAVGAVYTAGPRALGVIADGSWFFQPDLVGDGTFAVRSITVAGRLSDPMSIIVRDPCNDGSGEQGAETAEHDPNPTQPEADDGCTGGPQGLLTLMILAAQSIWRRCFARRVAIVAATVFGAMTYESVSRACSPVSIIGPPTTLPADGATAVPLNAEIVLVYPTTHLDQHNPPISANDFEDIVVRPVGGEALAGRLYQASSPATVHLRFSPDTPLAPNTTYEVLDRVHGNTRGELAVRLTFTTGAQAAEHAGPHPAPGPVNVRYACCDHMCCYGTEFTLEWPAVPERVFMVHRVAGPFVATASNSAYGVIANDASYSSPDLIGDGTFSVYAFDVTGWGSDPAPIFVTDPCASPRPDSSTEPTPDTTEPTPDDAGPGDGGCNSGAPHVLALTILAAKCIVRRRPHTIHSSRRGRYPR